jgi:CRP/FNR family transcriptional regulator, anaerobic regulatory protein
VSELEGFTLFSTVTGTSKELLKQGVICKEVPTATPVLHKGSQVSGAYIVLKGRLRVYSISPSGTEATLYTISPGETCILALNCLFNDFLYPAWVKSELKTKVAIVPGQLYRQLFGVEPSIQSFTVNALSTVVFRLMNELEQVHFCKLEHRLANLILTRANSEGVLKATQKDLADNLGTTREVVTRIMR